MKTITVVHVIAMKNSLKLIFIVFIELTVFLKIIENNHFFEKDNGDIQFKCGCVCVLA